MPWAPSAERGMRNSDCGLRFIANRTPSRLSTGVQRSRIPLYVLNGASGPRTRAKWTACESPERCPTGGPTAWGAADRRPAGGGHDAGGPLARPDRPRRPAGHAPRAASERRGGVRKRKLTPHAGGLWVAVAAWTTTFVGVLHALGRALVPRRGLHA
jgi:hypothetical protein